jgi:hypothetical protein
MFYMCVFLKAEVSEWRITLYLGKNNFYHSSFLCSWSRAVEVFFLLGYGATSLRDHCPKF